MKSFNGRLALVVLFALAVTLVVRFAVAAPQQDTPRQKQARKLVETLEPIHEEIGPVQPGDWLERNREPGQTFSQYIRSRPIRPTEKRTTLYVIPIGDFTDKQQEVFELTVEFMGHYFGTPVEVMDGVSLDVIPDKAKREHPSWGDDQILSTYVLYDLLVPKVPDDGWALLALTSSDLWPGDGWNFVFGQASLNSRVGVWSIYRNGDPSESEEAFKQCLIRTLKTATHETGHMLSINHCIYYECNMCGSNSQRESDRRPVYLCPICTAKITWATRNSPLERAQALKKFCEDNGLDESAEYYEKATGILENRR